MIDKILSWNVRGTNGSKKRLIIKGCLNRWKPSIICLHETKMEIINGRHIRSLWSITDSGLNFVPAKGAAGGIF